VSALLAVAEEDVTTGPIGLLLVAVLAVVTVLLVRNMNTRIKRLPPSFPDQGDRREDDKRPEDDDR
jgi:hypothetical protein